MSNKATRLRRVPPTRSAVRAALSLREIDRDLNRYRPATTAAARALWEV